MHPLCRTFSPPRILSLTLYCSLVPVFSHAVLCAQPVSNPCAEAPSQPGDLVLKLSLRNGQTTFREGEIIGLNAAYTSSADKKYHASTRNYDRSGRLMDMEDLCVDPTSGTDPLIDYFSGSMGFFGGGIGSDLELSSDPYLVPIELNEWRSLPPGSYRLRIVSNRIGVLTDETVIPMTSQRVTVQSNEVEFQVVNADSAWQSEQLASAIHTLDSTPPTSDEAKHAARVLRFLGSEASTRELARRFSSGNDQPFDWEFKFGLFGSPYRAIAIEAMKAALHDPQHSVSEEFILTLVVLEMQADPAQKLPPYDPKDPDAWHKLAGAYFAMQTKLIAQYADEVAASASVKTGTARAVTASELLESNQHLSTAARAQLRQMLADSWELLLVPRQNELVEYRWDQIGGPELLPVLRKIADGEPNPDRRIDKPDRAMAVLRIYELEPADGRALILKEITHPHGDIGINVLGQLPERELPQLESQLVANLIRHWNGVRAVSVSFELVNRYASAAALPAIQQIYEPARADLDCVKQSAMLRYFLRVSPEYGAAQVSDALARVNQVSSCKMLFSGLDEYLRRPRIEQLAIEALDDPSALVVRYTAEALEKNGSAKAEGALWARLEKLHDQWKSNPDMFRYRPGMGGDQLVEIGLEQTLVQAITNGQAWFADEETISRLKGLVSPQEQSQLDNFLADIQRREVSLNLLWLPQNGLHYMIGRYNGDGMAALKEKLAQFPAGTQLNLVTVAAERDRHSSEFSEIESAAAASGLTLHIQTPR